MDDTNPKPKRKISEATRAKNNERARKWREDHPGAMSEYMKGYREEHSEEMKQADRDYHKAHKEEKNAARKKWALDNPEKQKEGQQRWYNEKGGREHRRAYNLLKKYDLTVEQYQSILESQGGCCAICGTTNPGGKGCFHVDHDHLTGEVRGILCHFCNTGIGSLRDSVDLLQKAISYLKRLQAAKQLSEIVAALEAGGDAYRVPPDPYFGQPPKISTSLDSASL